MQPENLNTNGNVEVFAKEIMIENEKLRLIVDGKCIVKSLISKETGEECVSSFLEMPLFSATQDRPYNNENKLIYMNKRTVYPANRIRREENKLIVGFETAPFEAVVEITERPQYISFQLIEFIAKREDYNNLLVDLPPVVEFRLLQLPIIERKIFGDWLNVAWDEQTAVSVISLSPHARIDSEKIGNCRIMAADARKEIRLKGCMAALIVSKTEALLDCVAAAEEDYGLPRGVEGRRNPMINASIYWTNEITPDNVDEHIAYARKGGFRLMEIYHESIFKENYGTYQLTGNFDYREEYPEKEKDLKIMLDKLKEAGITPGFHFLQTFIGIKSRYITPVADSRLHLTRYFTLAKAIGKDDTLIYVQQNPEDSEIQTSTRRVLQFGGELIQYESYTTEVPYCFTGCTRGYLDTVPDSHAAGIIGGILDVCECGASSVYLDQNTDLQDEIAEKIAAAYNCGFEFLYYDGSEGTNVPFDYHVPNSQYRVYKKLGTEPLFSEGAAKSHFGWHILSGGNAFDIFPTEVFKEKIDQYPVRCAAYMKNNFTRVNFGWWGYFEDTQPDIYEYGTSRAAAWDCPVTMWANRENFKNNPLTDDNLEVMRRWEDVRRIGWLTEEQKQSMKNTSQEHILLINEKGEYELVPYEKIRGAAGGNTDFRAFIFERKGKRYVVCWCTLGTGKLRLQRKASELCYEKELGAGPLPLAEDGEGTWLPVAGRHYLSSEMSREELCEEIRKGLFVK